MPFLSLPFLLLLAFLAGSFNAAVESRGLGAGVHLAQFDEYGDYDYGSSYAESNYYSEGGYYGESSYATEGGFESSYPGSFDYNYDYDYPAPVTTPTPDWLTNPGVIETKDSREGLPFWSGEPLGEKASTWGDFNVNQGNNDLGGYWFDGWSAPATNIDTSPIYGTWLDTGIDTGIRPDTDNGDLFGKSAPSYTDTSANNSWLSGWDDSSWFGKSWNGVQQTVDDVSHFFGFEDQTQLLTPLSSDSTGRKDFRESDDEERFEDGRKNEGDTERFEDGKKRESVTSTDDEYEEGGDNGDDDEGGGGKPPEKTKEEVEAAGRAKYFKENSEATEQDWNSLSPAEKQKLGREALEGSSGPSIKYEDEEKVVQPPKGTYYSTLPREEQDRLALERGKQIAEKQGVSAEDWEKADSVKKIGYIFQGNYVLRQEEKQQRTADAERGTGERTSAPTPPQKEEPSVSPTVTRSILPEGDESARREGEKGTTETKEPGSFFKTAWTSVKDYLGEDEKPPSTAPETRRNFNPDEERLRVLERRCEGDSPEAERACGQAERLREQITEESRYGKAFDYGRPNTDSETYTRELTDKGEAEYYRGTLKEIDRVVDEIKKEEAAYTLEKQYWDTLEEIGRAEAVKQGIKDRDWERMSPSDKAYWVAEGTKAPPSLDAKPVQPPQSSDCDAFCEQEKLDTRKATSRSGDLSNEQKFCLDSPNDPSCLVLFPEASKAVVTERGIEIRRSTGEVVSISKTAPDQLTITVPDSNKAITSSNERWAYHQGSNLYWDKKNQEFLTPSQAQERYQKELAEYNRGHGGTWFERNVTNPVGGLFRGIGSFFSGSGTSNSSQQKAEYERKGYVYDETGKAWYDPKTGKIVGVSSNGDSPIVTTSSYPKGEEAPAVYQTYCATVGSYEYCVPCAEGGSAPGCGSTPLPLNNQPGNMLRDCSESGCTLCKGSSCQRVPIRQGPRYGVGSYTPENPPKDTAGRILYLRELYDRFNRDPESLTPAEKAYLDGKSI